MVGDWPESGRRVDTSIHSDMQEDIYTLEKNHPEDLSPVRKVDVFVVEFGETKGVNTYIVTPPLICELVLLLSSRRTNGGKGVVERGYSQKELVKSTN